MGMEPIHPPMEPLRGLLARLQTAGVTAALGGSGLLFAHGLVDRVNDWDLTTNSPPDLVRAALTGLTWEDRTGGGNYQTGGRFVVLIDGMEIDIMARLAVSGCSLPSIVAGEWQGVPLDSLEVWAAVYWLIGRPAKAGLILEHLRKHGASRERLRLVLRLPLPLDLRIALEELP